MIACSPRTLEHLCESEGRTLSDALPCVVLRNDPLWTVDDKHPAFPGRCDAAPRPGLGDHLERVLSAVGVTRARADAVAVAFGWDGCGCEERKEFLNEAGLKIGIGR